MAELKLSVELGADADTVWALVGRFGDLDAWHPWVPNCSLKDDGVTRVIDLGAMSAVERLVEEGPRTHSYVVEQSPMPITDYTATWTCEDADGGSVLSVVATFEPKGVPEAQAVMMLQGFFDQAFKTLKGRFDGV